MNNIPQPTTYEERFIAFIDVLGFGALVSASGEDGEGSVATIKRIGDAILCSREELEDLLSGSSDFVFTQFSDSFVISTEAANATERFGLSQFALAVRAVIDCFLGSELVLRGGVSRGKLIHTDKLLFGPAMNRAYELESRIAGVPRIIFDPNFPDLHGNMMPVMPEYVARDTDGLFYVDYFTPTKAFFLIPSWQYSIQQVIEAMPITAALAAKRQWMIAKFNASLAGFSFAGFKARLDAYVDDTDAINAVIEDYEELLEPARRLRRL
jgi:hypothetical protein